MALSDVLKIMVLALMLSANFKVCSSEDGGNTTTASYSDYSQSPNTDFDYDYGDFAELCTKEDNRRFRLWFMPTFYFVICLLGLIGNLLVILTFFYFKRLKTMTDVFLLNLSLADLLFALSLPFWAAESSGRWVLRLAPCKAIYTVYKVSFYSSMLFLSSISVDRYFAISRAVSAHRHRSRVVWFSKASSLVIWLMSVLFSVPEMIYTGVVSSSCTPFSSRFDKTRIGVQTSQLMVAFVVPLLVMSFCYSNILQTLWRARTFQRNKAIRVVLAVVAVFLLSQVPFNLVLLWTTVNIIVYGVTADCGYDNALLYATDVTQCVAFLRCCLNPFVYAFVGVKFRHDLLKLLKDWGCVRQHWFSKFTSGRRSSGANETDTSTSFYA